jgi:hypothetical protein
MLTDLDVEPSELLARSNPLWRCEPAVGHWIVFSFVSEGEESLMISQARLLLCYLRADVGETIRAQQAAFASSLAS